MAFRNIKWAVLAHAEIRGLPMDKKVKPKIPENVNMTSLVSQKDYLASAPSKKDNLGSTELKDNNATSAIPEEDAQVCTDVQDHTIVSATSNKYEEASIDATECNPVLVVPEESNPVSTDFQENNLASADAGRDNLAFTHDDSITVKKNDEVVIEMHDESNGADNLDSAVYKEDNPTDEVTKHNQPFPSIAKNVSAAIVSENHSDLAVPEKKGLAFSKYQDTNIAFAVADQENSAFNEENTTVPPEKKDEAAVNMSEPGNQQLESAAKTPTKTRVVQVVPEWGKNTHYVFITIILCLLVWAGTYFSMLPSKEGGKGPLK